ncbi:hypothetical protein JL09_g6808, partial [Pichia kudriavzevii]
LITGPTAAPLATTHAYKANAAPRYAGSHKSAKTPPEETTGAPEKTPARNLHIINEGTL